MRPLNFKIFFEEQELNELFAVGAPPKDGQWDGSTFYFNIPEDPNCSNVENGRCYRVDFGDDGYGVGIAFKPTYSGSYNATGANVQSQVGQGVTYALSQYIKQHSPKKLHWIPVTKNGGGEKNPEARRHVYSLWMRKNLFPDQYVPFMQDDPMNPEHPASWIRRDEYDKIQAEKGLPKLPPPEDTTINKSVLYKQLVTTHKEIYEKAQKVRQAEYERTHADEIARRQEAQTFLQRQRDLEQTNQRQREAERNQMIMRLVSDSQVNPAKIGIGDAVQSRFGNYWYRGKVSGFQISQNGELQAIVTDKVDAQNQPIENSWMAPDDEPISGLHKISAGMFGKEKLSR